MMKSKQISLDVNCFYFFFFFFFGFEMNFRVNMPRYDDRYGSATRLYVGHLSSRTRSRDLERLFSKYGR